MILSQLGGDILNENIGDRIGELIKAMNMKKVRFAERIKVDQSYITQLTNNKRSPSDRIIADICREFNANEEWLRTGNGNMFLELSEDEFAKAASSLSNDVFVRNLIIEYWKLDDDSKKLFRNFIHNLSDSMKHEESYNEPESDCMTIQALQEIREQIPKTPEELEKQFPPVESDKKKPRVG